MEYIASFLTFFVIYFCVNILLVPLRKRVANKNKANTNTAGNNKKKNQLNQAKSKKITKEDIKEVFKSSLTISLIYVVVLFALKRFS